LTADPGTAPRPGLREEIGQTRDAISRLVRAHVDLLRAELAEIADRIKVIAALGGILAGIAFFVSVLLVVGAFLFLGEWLFGSIGWGVVDGALLGLGAVTALSLVLMSVPARTALLTFVVAVVIAVVVGLGLAFNVPRRAAEAAADAVRISVPTLDPAWAPAVVSVVFLAIVFGVIALLLGARAGGAVGAIGGLAAGAILGALLGLLLGGLTYSGQGGVALGVTVGLLSWPILQFAAARGRIRPTARFERLWPRETYETALETRAWLEKEWARRRQRLASR
jgi:hypothetical protein